MVVYAGREIVRGSHAEGVLVDRQFRGFIEEGEGTFILDFPQAIMRTVEVIQLGNPDTILYMENDISNFEERTVPDDGNRPLGERKVDYTILNEDGAATSEDLHVAAPNSRIRMLNGGTCKMGLFVDWKFFETNPVNEHFAWMNLFKAFAKISIRRTGRLFRLNGLGKVEVELDTDKDTKFYTSCNAGKSKYSHSVPVPSLCSFDEHYETTKPVDRSEALLGNFSVFDHSDYCLSVFFAWRPEMSACGHAYLATPNNFYGGICAEHEDGFSGNTLIVNLYDDYKLSPRLRGLAQISRTVEHEILHAFGADHSTSVPHAAVFNIMHPVAFSYVDEDALLYKNRAYFVSHLAEESIRNVTKIVNERTGCLKTKH